MTEIRYTAGGDYSAANSVDVTPTSADHATSVINDRDLDWLVFYDNSQTTFSNIPPAPRNDGLFADFSDHTTSVHLQGGEVGDLLIGGAAADQIEGGGGEDVIEGGAGADQLTGDGDGLSTATYAHSSQGVFVDLSGNTANTGGDAQGDTLSGIENLVGSANRDFLTGDINANVIDGGQGNDHIFGGDGNDTMIGGSGADRAVGGAGADTFLYQSLSDFGGRTHGAAGVDSVVTKPGQEAILDFSSINGSNEGDQIDLSGIASFKFETGHAFVPADGPSIYLSVNKHGVQIVHGDADGDGHQNFSFKVRADGTLQDGDFILIPLTSSATHPTGAAFTVHDLYDTHPVFSGGMHVMEHMAIA